MDIGLHVTTGSRNGYGQAAPEAAVCVSLVGGAFDEVGANCYRIYRPREVYLNGPPEWDTTSVFDMPALADQWWPHLLARVQEIEAAHGDIDALQLTNEMVGNNAENARKLVAYEGRLLDHAEAAGYTLCVGNLSANSPDWNSSAWQDILAPFIRVAWAMGHVYSRHVYFDIEPLADNWNRAFRELDYLREQGPTGGVVLTELGFVNFPGADSLIAGLREYEEAAADYPEIGLGAIFTYGDWSGGEGNANIEAASSQLADYLEAPDEKWQPPTVDPNPDPPSTEHAIWDASVAEQIARGIPLNPNALLQRYILDDGFVPVHRERRYRDGDGVLWAYQAAETVDGSQARRVYRCRDKEDGSYGDVTWFVEPGDEPEPAPPPSGSVTFPVGTAAEREAATDVWPGAWFDANPYGNYYHVRDGHYAYHTGADLNLNQPTWDSDRGKPVFAIGDGEVAYAGRWNDAWGIIIVIDHGGFYSRYSAVDGLEVAVGDVVSAGQQIAVIDQHGEGEPYHLHFDVSPTDKLAENPGDWPGTDLDRLHRDYVPPLPFILERRVQAPPGIDLLPYFMGAHGRSIELEYTWGGGGTHPLQVQHGDGAFWYVKGDNGEFEELWAGDQYIYRGIDTSEAYDKYYVQYTPLPDRLAYGARWIPRFMRVGETAEFAPYVIHYWQADCGPRGIQGQPLNRISLLAVHDSYTFPSGITLQDVIEVGWEGQERYWFAVDYGLVGWQGEGVGQSYISQIHDDRPLTRNVPGCWQTPERYRG